MKNWMRENRAKALRFVYLPGCFTCRKSNPDEWVEQNVVQATD